MSYYAVDFRAQTEAFPGQHQKECLYALDQTLRLALNEHPRTLVIRVDLRLPHIFQRRGRHPISLFYASLKSQIEWDLERKRSFGESKRVYRSNVRYFWVRERADAQQPHYHVVILLNGYAYNSLGAYSAESGNMAARIRRAWASALACPATNVSGLVHFPEKPLYILRVSCDGDIVADREDFSGRMTYMAKNRTKEQVPGERTFGCSRR